MEKISSLAFYDAWHQTIVENKEKIEKLWTDCKAYTDFIKGDENSIMEVIALKLNLLCYPRDYYSIDTILYKQEDLVHKIKQGTFWFRDIRVAFEHENNFNSGLYQEVSHLLIINADLKVLVTYPNREKKNELDYLHEIISGNRQFKSISENESFLIIFGYEESVWEGFVYKENGWKNIITQEILQYNLKLNEIIKET